MRVIMKCPRGVKSQAFRSVDQIFVDATGMTRSGPDELVGRDLAPKYRIVGPDQSRYSPRCRTRGHRTRCPLRCSAPGTSMGLRGDGGSSTRVARRVNEALRTKKGTWSGSEPGGGTPLDILRGGAHPSCLWDRHRDKKMSYDAIIAVISLQEGDLRLFEAAANA